MIESFHTTARFGARFGVLERIVTIVSVAATDIFIVDGILFAGGGYDILNDGYLGDYMNSGDASELLDLHELNVAEIVGIVGLLLSLAIFLTAGFFRQPSRAGTTENIATV